MPIDKPIGWPPYNAIQLQSHRDFNNGQQYKQTNNEKIQEVKGRACTNKRKLFSHK